MLFEPYVRFHNFGKVRVTVWHLLGNSCLFGFLSGFQYRSFILIITSYAFYIVVYI